MVAHLNIAEIDLVLSEEVLEFLEVLFCGAVVPTVRPDSLQNSIFDNESPRSRRGASGEKARMLKFTFLLLQFTMARFISHTELAFLQMMVLDLPIRCVYLPDQHTRS